MKHLFQLFLLLGLATTAISCGGDDNENDSVSGNKNINANASSKPSLNRLEVPRVKGGNSIILVHSVDGEINYMVEWDCLKKAQRWSAYEMYASNSVGNWKRSNWYSTSWGGDPFQEDPSLPTEFRTTLEMYRGSGYNRGHICPSADRLNSMEANEQTFYLSNMQPQLYSLNGGLWGKMENQVRTWNKGSFRDTLYVVKGGTIDHENQIKGYTSSGLLIPQYFFMAILCKNAEGYKAIGFWVDHQTTDHSADYLSGYVKSIDELENLTGIDFFCNLPDATEEHVESKTYIASWGLSQ